MSFDIKQYDAYVERNKNWNFAVNLLDLTFFNLAVSFVFGATVLSLYASYLTSSAILIGLIPAIQSVGYFLPQLLLAQRSERLSRKKPLIQKISIVERLPYLFVALLAILWPQTPAWLAYTVLALSLAMATGAGGLAGPAWQAMLAKVIPVGRRGRLFGLSSALGGLLGIGGAAISRQVLAKYPYPVSFGICFGFCFVSQVISWICLSLNREPHRPPTKTAVPVRTYWRQLPSVLSHNVNFTRYLVARSLIILGGMSTAFYIIYARNAFAIDNAFAANLTIAALISQTISTPALGGLGDKIGHNWVLELCTGIAAVGILLALVAPEVTWLYAVFALVNAGTAGMSVAGMGIVLEFCDTESIPTFTGLANTLTAVPILVAPVLGGWLVDLAGYQTLFIVALVLSISGWAFMRWGVREPRHEQNGIIPDQI